MATTPIIRIKTNVCWKAVRDEESGYWVASCEALNLTVQGKTYGELMQSAAEAQDLLLEDLLQSGELDSFLREQGWQMNAQSPRRGDRVRFDLPFSVKMPSAKRHDSTAVAA